MLVLVLVPLGLVLRQLDEGTGSRSAGRLVHSRRGNGLLPVQDGPRGLDIAAVGLDLLGTSLQKRARHRQSNGIRWPTTLWAG